MRTTKKQGRNTSEIKRASLTLITGIIQNKNITKWILKVCPHSVLVILGNMIM
jgi:hypothetical protein